VKCTEKLLEGDCQRHCVGTHHLNLEESDSENSTPVMKMIIQYTVLKMFSINQLYNIIFMVVA
jgi:hypothetical protein